MNLHCVEPEDLKIIQEGLLIRAGRIRSTWMHTKQGQAELKRVLKILDQIEYELKNYIQVVQ